MCDIIFEKAKRVYTEAVVQRLLSKSCYEKFRRIHNKASVPESLFFVKVKLCKSAASLKTRP